MARLRVLKYEFRKRPEGTKLILWTPAARGGKHASYSFVGRPGVKGGDLLQAAEVRDQLPLRLLDEGL